MRRKVGVSVVKGKKEELAQFSKVGKALEENKLSFVQDVLSNFRTTLMEFASKHKERINSDPEFRQQFHRMCLTTGVDPLASSKGFWADLLGVGDFYFELGVKIIQIAVQTRALNGGIMPLEEMRERLESKAMTERSQRRASHTQAHTAPPRVSEEDIQRAVEKIAVLGSGFRLLNLGRKHRVILSVPVEITNDHQQVLDAAEEEGGMVSEDLMKTHYGWSKERFQFIIRPLLTEGMVWVDDYEGQRAYYFPSLSSFRL
eukprot:scaffold510_cov179-Ochromonas_danica.AAC.6